MKHIITIIFCSLISTLAFSQEIRLNVKPVISGFYDSVTSQIVLKDNAVYVVTETEYEWDDEGDSETALYITKLDNFKVIGHGIYYAPTNTLCAQIIEKKRNTVIRMTRNCKFQTKTTRVRKTKESVTNSYDLSSVCSFEEDKDLGLTLKTCKTGGDKKLSNKVNVDMRDSYSEREYSLRKYDYFVLSILK